MEIELDVQGEKGCAALEKFAEAIVDPDFRKALTAATWATRDLEHALERKFPDKTDRSYIEGKKRIDKFLDAVTTLKEWRVASPSTKWRLEI